MTPRLAFVLPLLALTACPKAPSKTAALPSVPRNPAVERRTLEPQVAELARQAEEVLCAQDELVWRNWTEGTGGDLGQTYQGKEALFSPISVEKIEQLRALTSAPQDVRALTHLQNYYVGEVLARSTLELTDALANLEASMTFTVEGHEYPYRDLDRLLANERSAPKRRALYEGASADVERLSQTLRRKDERLEALVLSMGFPSYESFGAELRQVDLAKLGVLAEQTLESTDAPYRKVLERLGQQELQLPLDQMSRADLPRLFRLRGVDAFFPKSQLMPRAQQTLKGMGLDLSTMKNVHLDLKDSPRKNGRGLTLPVRVPGDVRVSLKLTGGVRDQRSLFHELGHALHDGLTTEPRFELAKLGNSTVSEAFSILFEDLVEDPLWLEEHAGLSGQKLSDYLFAASAHRLFVLRRAAGKLLYQLALHRGGQPDAKALDKSILPRAFGVAGTPADEARFIVDEEDFYPSADYFRAWSLAGQLEAALKARFGGAWWKSAEAGTFLRGLWASGNGRSADELAQSLGDATVTPTALLKRLSGPLKAQLVAAPDAKPAADAKPAGDAKPAPTPEQPAPSAPPATP